MFRPNDRLAEHVPSLRAYLQRHSWRQLLQRESCSDLVQSVCREALDASPDVSFTNDGQFSQWLFAIAKAKLVDRFRQQSAQKRVRPGIDVDADQAPAQQPSPSECAAIDEGRERIGQAIEALPADQREVVWLARILELPHERIAALMGRSEVATRKLLSRALAQLGSLLV